MLDQILKIWIKTHYILGEESQIFDWFIIHFTENNGMADNKSGIWEYFTEEGISDTIINYNE